MSLRPTPEIALLTGIQVRALDKCPDTELGEIVAVVQEVVRGRCLERQRHPVDRVTNEGIVRDEVNPDPKCNFKIKEIPDAVALEFSCLGPDNCPNQAAARTKALSLVADSILLNAVQPFGYSARD